MVKVVFKWLIFKFAKVIFMLVWYLFLQRKVGLGRKAGILIYALIKRGKKFKYYRHLASKVQFRSL